MFSKLGPSRAARFAALGALLAGSTAARAVDVSVTSIKDTAHGAAAHLNAARAVDLSVTSIEIIQAVQFGNTTLVGDKATVVRAFIGVADSPGPVPNVDATLRMFVDGEEAGGSPFHSVNGPIEAPLNSNREFLNHTVNFIVLPPVGDDIDFVVEVNPDGRVQESNRNNNVRAANDKFFACRKIVEFAYVNTDYRPGGGPPDPRLCEPGIGDGFLRAIYAVGEWNYHRAPLPDLVWEEDINDSDTRFLNTLRDIRVNQIPRDGFPMPEFVYGWLPGNPYGGNGRAIGIPGDVAFGNTETIRHQRTMAHEVGHLWGLVHTGERINTVGLDAEHHLWDTERLPQAFPPSKYDVMVAGQLTNAAFVSSSTYTRALIDERSQCRLPLGGEAEDAVLRVSGRIDNVTREVRLDPVVRLERNALDPSDPDGDILIAGYAADGAVLFTTGYVTTSNLQPCTDPTNPELLDAYSDSPIHARVPAMVNGVRVDRLEVIDAGTGITLASRRRSPNAPEIAITAVADARVWDGPVRVEWTGRDADGDALTYNLLYSPDDGESWYPLAVNITDNVLAFDSGVLAASRGPHGRVKLVATDGLNTVEDSYGPIETGPGSPPETFLLTPNADSVHLEDAPIAFHAAAWDREDLMLDGDAIVWTSDRDGPFGAGRILVFAGLSVGRHLITVTATDADGMSSQKQVALVVQQRVRQISCRDVRRFRAECSEGGTVTGLVKLKSTDFDGGQVTFRVGQSNFDVTIRGRKAKLFTCCYGGPTEVELIDPAGCKPPQVVDCP